MLAENRLMLRDQVDGRSEVRNQFMYQNPGDSAFVRDCRYSNRNKLEIRMVLP